MKQGSNPDFVKIGQALQKVAEEKLGTFGKAKEESEKEEPLRGKEQAKKTLRVSSKLEKRRPRKLFRAPPRSEHNDLSFYMRPTLGTIGGRVQSHMQKYDPLMGRDLFPRSDIGEGPVGDVVSATLSEARNAERYMFGLSPSIPLYGGIDSPIPPMSKRTRQRIVSRRR